MPLHASRIASETHARTAFVFREVRTRAELRDVLALRYHVFSDSPGLPRPSSLDHACKLDLDAYDPVSRHFALFARVWSEELVVGTLRITNGRPGHCAQALRSIAEGRPSLEAKIGAPRTAELPMFSYLEQAPAVRASYMTRHARGERMAEPGRLTLHPRVRVAAARAGLRLSHLVVIGALAVGWHLERLDRVFVDCITKLRTFYEHFGFRVVPGGEPAYQPTLGTEFVVLEATPSSLPADLVPEVERCARDLRRHGEVTLEPDPAPAPSPRSQHLDRSQPCFHAR